MKKLFNNLALLTVTILILTLSIFTGYTLTKAEALTTTLCSSEHILVNSSEHPIEGSFGLTLGTVFDKSLSIASENNKGMIIHQVRPPQPNAVFDEYRVALTLDNRIHSIYARAVMDRETAITLKAMLISVFKIEYSIKDNFISNKGNMTMMFQGNKGIVIDINGGEVSLMFIDISLCEKNSGSHI